VRIDFAEALRTAGVGFRPVEGGRELLLDECYFCGRRRKMYANARTGRHNCFICETRGNGIKLLRKAAGLTYQEVKTLLKGTYRVRSSSLTDILDLLGRGEERDEAPVRIALPREYIPCYQNGKTRIPTYLKERALTSDTIRAFALGWCDRGVYGGRIVLPVRCGEYRTYLARATRPEILPKYLNAPQYPQGKVLYGYHQALEAGPGPLIIVEGAFDVLNLYQLGYRSVGLFGKNLTQPHLALLPALAPTAIFVMLDSDATIQACELATRLGTRYPTRLVSLQSGDPGDLRDSQEVVEALGNSSSADRLTRLSALLEK